MRCRLNRITCRHWKWPAAISGVEIFVQVVHQLFRILGRNEVAPAVSTNIHRKRTQLSIYVIVEHGVWMCVLCVYVDVLCWVSPAAFHWRRTIYCAGEYEYMILFEHLVVVYCLTDSAFAWYTVRPNCSGIRTPFTKSISFCFRMQMLEQPSLTEMGFLWRPPKIHLQF